MTATPMLTSARAFEETTALGALVSFVRRLAAIRRGRSALAHLAECDDHLLADLGLSRADLAAAFERPVAGDPSAHLASIVSARRAQGRL